MLSEKLSKLVIDETGLASAEEDLSRDQAKFVRRCLKLAEDIAEAAGFSLVTVFSDPYEFCKDGRVRSVMVDADNSFGSIAEAINSSVLSGGLNCGMLWVKKPTLESPDPDNVKQMV